MGPVFETLSPRRGVMVEILEGLLPGLKAGDPEAWGRLVEFGMDGGTTCVEEVLSNLIFGEGPESYVVLFGLRAWYELQEAARSHGLTTESAAVSFVDYALAWINRDFEGFVEWVEAGASRDRDHVSAGTLMQQSHGNALPIHGPKEWWWALGEPKNVTATQRKTFMLLGADGVLEMLILDPDHREAALSLVPAA